MPKQSLLFPNVLVYLLLSFGVAWIVILVLPPIVPFQIRGALAMLAPALGAWLVRGPIFKEGFEDAGLAPRLKQSWRTYLAAYLLVPALIFAGFLLSVTVGLQHWGVQPLDRVLASFGVTSALPHGAHLTGALPPSAVIAMAIGSLTFYIPINMLFTFGEEFGWRGYLLVRLPP